MTTSALAAPAGTFAPHSSVSPPSPAGGPVLDPAASQGLVLIVDDRPERRSVLRTLLQTPGWAGTTLVEAASDVEAVAAMRAAPIDVAVVEIQMPVAAGLAVVTALRAGQPAMVIVVCSFLTDRATRAAALAAGADAYLTKPVSTRDLLLACRPPKPPPTPSSGNGSPSA